LNTPVVFAKPRQGCPVYRKRLPKTFYFSAARLMKQIDMLKARDRRAAGK
jgi:hypothetical protein